MKYKYLFLYGIVLIGGLVGQVSPPRVEAAKVTLEWRQLDEGPVRIVTGSKGEKLEVRILGLGGSDPGLLRGEVEEPTGATEKQVVQVAWSGRDAPIYSRPMVAHYLVELSQGLKLVERWQMTMTHGTKVLEVPQNGYVFEASRSFPFFSDWTLEGAWIEFEPGKGPIAGGVVADWVGTRIGVVSSGGTGTWGTTAVMKLVLTCDKALSY